MHILLGGASLVEPASRAHSVPGGPQGTMNGEKQPGHPLKLTVGWKRIDKLKNLELTVRSSLPLVFLPARWPFIGVRFFVALKFFDLCAFPAAYLLSPSIPVSGPMVSMSVVGTITFRV